MPCSPFSRIDPSPFLVAVADRLRSAGVFGDAQITDAGLTCQAKNQLAATYRLSVEPSGQSLVIGLFVTDRWLSESIETDLLHTGDKMEELLEDELVELGWETAFPIEHFRNDAKEYVFRSRLAIPCGQTLSDPAIIDQATLLMLGYQATFAPLGDMLPPSPSSASSD